MKWTNLTIRNIHVEYRQRGLPSVFALNGASIKNIQRGSFNVIRGDNGSGKTTLLKVLLGRIHAGAGEILLDDFPILPKQLRQRSKLAYVPQKPSTGMVNSMTVAENIVLRQNLLPRECSNSSLLSSNFTKLEQLFSSIKGCEFLTKERLSGDPRALSGGQQQIVTVLSCLLSEADILLMDEPTSKLSPERESIFWHIVTSLRNDCTFIVTSHKNISVPNTKIREERLVDGKLEKK